MAQYGGAVPDTCASYDWCSKASECSNSVVPEFYGDSESDKKDSGISSSCESGSTPTVYRTKKNSAMLLDGNDAIKRQIFTKGPLPCGFYVFSDFYLANLPTEKNGLADNWKNTGGIYAHLGTDGRTTPRGDVSPYNYASPEQMNNIEGGHAVVIVGWGVAEVKNFVPKAYPGKDTIQLPFWWVRNSWGTDWCEGGYFRIAMTDPFAYINTDVKLDASNDRMGGVIDFDIDNSKAPVPSPRPFPVPSRDKQTDTSSNFIMKLGIVILVVILGALLFMFLKKRR